MRLRKVLIFCHWAGKEEYECSPLFPLPEVTFQSNNYYKRVSRKKFNQEFTNPIGIEGTIYQKWKGSTNQTVHYKWIWRRCWKLTFVQARFTRSSYLMIKRLSSFSRMPRMCNACRSFCTSSGLWIRHHPRFASAMGHGFNVHKSIVTTRNINALWS